MKPTKLTKKPNNTNSNNNNIVKTVAVTIFNTVQNKSIKEHLILSLRNELRYHEDTNAKMNQTLSNVSTHRIKLKENGIDLNRYCNQMRNKMQTFVTKVDHYEGLITLCKTDKRRIINSNEAVIKQKKAEEAELKHQMELVSMKIESQLEQLNALEEKIGKLEERKKEEGKEMMMREKDDKMKHNQFYAQYQALMSKFNIYEQEKEEYKNESQFIDRMKPKTTAVVSSDDMKIKLNEMRIKNELLKTDKDVLIRKIENIKILNKQIKKNDNYSTRFNTIANTTASNSNSIHHTNR